MAVLRASSAAAMMLSLVVTIGVGQNCMKTGVAPSPPERPYFAALEVHGNTRLSIIGETSQLRAMADYSDGSSADVTANVAWSVPPGSIVSVSGAGVVEALGLGISSVHAVYGITARAVVDLPISVTPAGTFAVRGQVRYAPAGGIAAVTVTEPVSARATVTDDDGMFMLAGLVGTDVLLTREGYEPVTTAVPPFKDQVELLMQPVIRLQAGQNLTGTIATEDLTYAVMPGTACVGCRLIRIQSATTGRLSVKLTWFAAGSRMFLWANGQEFSGAESLQLVATFPVQAGETIVYVGAASGGRDVDYELTTVFAPS